jgi:pyruvate dehydrogenase E1 component beta subunit
MRIINYTEAITEALGEEMARDEKVVMWGEDIAAAGGAFYATPGLVDEFGPERVRDTPIAENIIVGLAVGAAATGLRPVPEIMFSDFMAYAMDPIANQMAKMRYMSGGQVTLPITIRTASGAGLRAAAQHSQSLHPWIMNLPGVKVVMPSTPADAKGLLKTSIRDDNPVIFFEHKGLYNLKGEVPEGDYLIPLGKADIKRLGTDVTIVAVQWMVHEAFKAAEQLAAMGISAEVVDPRTLVPLDREAIATSVRKTRRVVIVDECNLTGGAQSEIMAVVIEEAFDYLDAPPRRLGVPNTPFPVSPGLEDYLLPNADKITAAVEALIR